MSTLLYLFSKLVGFLIQADTWLTLGLAWTVVASWRKRHESAKRIATVTFALTLAVALLPLGDLLLYPLETGYPTTPKLDQVDGILVLGGAEDQEATVLWKEPQMNEGAERFTAAMALARRFPGAPVLFSGGTGALRELHRDGLPRVNVGERFFLEQQLEPSRLILENRSRNTTENAQFSYRIAHPGPEERWVLITSAFHMKRAMHSFREAGWRGLIPYPVDYRTHTASDAIGWNLAQNLERLNLALKEWVGLLAYRGLGR